MWVQDNMAQTICKGYEYLQKKNIQKAKKPELKSQQTGRMNMPTL
jgi:hypothetical protein